MKFTSLVVALLSTTQVAAAQDYPTKRVEHIVAFGPGGGADTVARAVGNGLQALWGQPVVIENRVGAEGVIGATVVSKAKPDGYTMLWTTSSLTLTAALGRPTAKLVSDFVPVAIAAQSPHVLAAHPNLGVKTMADLYAFCRANPGKLKFGSSGEGTTAAILADQISVLAGCEATIVPYKGSGESTAALLGNEVDALFSSPGALLNHIRDERLVGLASDIKLVGDTVMPVVGETAGFEAFKAAPLWYGILAPKGTPPEIIAKVNADIAQVVKDPQIAGLFAERAMEPVGNNPEEFATQITDEIAAWKALAEQ